MMATSVDFNTTNGVPRLVRSTSVPTRTSATVVFGVQIVSYPPATKFLPLFNFESSANDIYWEIRMYMGNQGTQDDFWTDGYTGQFAAAAVFRTGPAADAYYKRAGGSFTTAFTGKTIGAGTNDDISICAHTQFLTDMSGRVRWSFYKVWNVALTTSEIQEEMLYRIAVRTSGLVFANRMLDAANPQVDESATANFTLTGTPTLDTGDTGFSITPPGWLTTSGGLLTPPAKQLWMPSGMG
jgi:hypothetical protein